MPLDDNHDVRSSLCYLHFSCDQTDLCRFTMSGKVSGLPHRSKRALFTQKKNLDRIIVIRNPPGVTTGQWVVHGHMILCHMTSYRQNGRSSNDDAR